MTDWKAMSLNSLKAAKHLHARGFARSAASRAYFAAYAAVALRLPSGMTFADDRPNPGHKRIHTVAKHNVTTRLSPRKRQQLSQNMIRLRENRLVSDYDSKATVDRVTSMDSVRTASVVLDMLEVM